MKKLLFLALTTLLIASCSPKGNTNDSINPISGDGVIYTVEFKNYDSSFLWSTTVEKGGTVVYDGETPKKPGTEYISYIFFGFDKSTINVQSNIVTYAQFKKVYNYTNGLTFELNKANDAFFVSGYKGTDTSVLVPEKFYNESTSKYLPVTAIKKEAFFKSSITSIKLPASIVNIGSSAFHSSKKLQKIEIPEGVINIGSSAFAYCQSLTSLYISSTVESLNLAYSVVGCTSLTSIKFAEGSPLDYFVAEDGVILNKKKTTLVYYPAVKVADSYSTPAGIDKIGMCAFDHSQIKQLTISEGVTSIEGNVFDDSLIEELSLPSTLSKIHEGAIASKCYKLKTIKVNESAYFAVENKMLVKINGDNDNTRTIIMYPNADLSDELIIDRNVSAISYNALVDMVNVKTIFIPNSVKHITSQSLPAKNLIYLEWDETSNENPTNFADLRANREQPHTETDDMYLFTNTDPKQHADPISGYTYWHYVDGVKTLWNN